MLTNHNLHWGNGEAGTVFDETNSLGHRNRPKGIRKCALYASYLDPRMKDLIGLDAEDKGKVKAAIREKLFLQCGGRPLRLRQAPPPLVLRLNLGGGGGASGGGGVGVAAGLRRVDVEAIGAPARQRRRLGRPLTAAEQEQIEINELLGIMDDDAEEEVPAPARHQTPAEIDGEFFALVDAEMRLYDGEPKLARIVQHHDGPLQISNPLEWWRKNQCRFPRLALLAARYLAVPATSAPVERLFSTAGLTISKLRARLLPVNAAMLVFLHENLPLVRAWRLLRGLPPVS